MNCDHIRSERRPTDRDFAIQTILLWQLEAVASVIMGFRVGPKYFLKNFFNHQFDFVPTKHPFSIYVFEQIGSLRLPVRQTLDPLGQRGVSLVWSHDPPFPRRASMYSHCF
jgi:hypothetical protein